MKNIYIIQLNLLGYLFFFSSLLDNNMRDSSLEFSLDALKIVLLDVGSVGIQDFCNRTLLRMYAYVFTLYDQKNNMITN